MEQLISEYIKRMHTALELPAMKEVPKLAAAMQLAWKNKKTIYLCGNGGSAGNANHLANDFLYGAGVKNGIGLRIDSLARTQQSLLVLQTTLVTKTFIPSNCA
jgi:D-sedoheptulose 7-phosphate isomerase